MELKDYLEKIRKSAPKFEKGLKLIGETIRSDILVSMANTPRDTSRTYMTESGIKHHPSKPNNPPAPDTGALRQSIHYVVHAEKDAQFVEVGSTMSGETYPIELEYGTSKIAPRPWLRPSLQRNMTFIKDTIEKSLEDVLNV